jgi:mannose-1-phosphate guanylyltransferase
MIRQAFVLGAGLGTRLRPLTDDLPKPLMPIFQKPLITFALDHLLAAGVESFVINTHHLAAYFETLFADGAYAGRPVKLVHEPDLLETGGGIKNVQQFLTSAPFIVYSGDILTDFNLEPLLEEHVRRGNDVTLALRETGLASGVVLEDGRVTAITKADRVSGSYDYANVSIWSPQAFDRIPPDKKISFIPILVEWIRQNGRIGGVVLSDGKWFNIGSRKEYLQVHREIGEQRWKPDYIKTADWPVRVAQSATVDASAAVRGCSVVAEGCQVGPGAILYDTILWPGAQIASRTDLVGCIVRSRQKVQGTHRNTDL